MTWLGHLFAGISHSHMLLAVHTARHAGEWRLAQWHVAVSVVALGDRAGLVRCTAQIGGKVETEVNRKMNILNI